MQSRTPITRCLLLPFALNLACGLISAQAQTVIDITPKPDDNFVEASFTLLLPQKNKRPRYILVLVPGFNASGQDFLQHPRWRAFAEASGGAIIACTFRALPEESPEEIENYVHYAAAQYGSGAALESAIEQFASVGAMPWLKNLPLLIYGHSAGGQFAYGFTCHHPQRVIGFAAVKGGYYYPEPVDGTYQVPGLLISGEQDLSRRRKEIRSLFESHRKHAAPWCWMEDKSGHGIGLTLDVILPYFKELLRIRLAGDGKTLKPISINDGVLFDLRSKTILGQTTTTDGKAIDVNTAFLPSTSVFELWAQQDTGKSKYLEHPDPAENNREK